VNFLVRSVNWRASPSDIVDNVYTLGDAELYENVENALNLGHFDNSANYKILPSFVIADNFSSLAKVSICL